MGKKSSPTLKCEILVVWWKISGWWFGCHQFYFPINIGFMSSSQLTNSYFSEGWPNHKPDIVVFFFILTSLTFFCQQSSPKGPSWQQRMIRERYEDVPRSWRSNYEDVRAVDIFWDGVSCMFICVKNECVDPQLSTNHGIVRGIMGIFRIIIWEIDQGR